MTEALGDVGKAVGATFGDVERPLLVSVRSGARASMPGMMDTILNLGLNDETVKGLAASSGNERFAYDSYRRFIQMYSDVVLGIDHGVFEDILDSHKNLNGLTLDTELDADDWLEVIDEYKDAVERETGKPFPQDHGRAAVGRHRRRVRLLAEHPRQDLPPPARHSRQLGHRRQRAGDGVRQPGQLVRHRRRLHAQSVDRRRARSTASSCSMHRARTWWPASARRSR